MGQEPGALCGYKWLVFFLTQIQTKTNNEKRIGNASALPILFCLTVPYVDAAFLCKTTRPKQGQEEVQRR